MTPEQIESRLAEILEKLRDWKAMTRSETLLLLAEYQEVFKSAMPESLSPAQRLYHEVRRSLYQIKNAPESL